MPMLENETSTQREGPDRRAVQRIALPPSALGHSTLDRIDYADAFLVDTGNFADRSAEEWARATIEDATLGRRMSLTAGWTALGLRLGAPWSTKNVLGWEIRRNEPDLVLLGARSRLGLAGELLFERQQDGLLFSTRACLTNSLARAVWSRVVPGHCKVVRHLLTDAAGRSRP
jgi:hypothetical protein